MKKKTKNYLKINDAMQKSFMPAKPKRQTDEKRERERGEQNESRAILVCGLDFKLR